MRTRPNDFDVLRRNVDYKIKTAKQYFVKAKKISEDIHQNKVPAIKMGHAVKYASTAHALLDSAIDSLRSLKMRLSLV